MASVASGMVGGMDDCPRASSEAGSVAGRAWVSPLPASAVAPPRPGLSASSQTEPVTAADASSTSSGPTPAPTAACSPSGTVHEVASSPAAGGLAFSRVMLACGSHAWALFTRSFASTALPASRAAGGRERGGASGLHVWMASGLASLRHGWLSYIQAISKLQLQGFPRPRPPLSPAPKAGIHPPQRFPPQATPLKREAPPSTCPSV